MEWEVAIKEIDKEPKRTRLQCSWPLAKIRRYFGLDRRYVDWFTIEKVR